MTIANRFLSVFFAAALLTACSGSTEITVVNQPVIRPQTAPDRPETGPTSQQTLLRIGETEMIYGLDPLLAQTNAGKRLSGLIYQGLTGLNADGEVIPQLAQSWEVSDDSLVYTFRLHPEASFHDSPRFIDGRGRSVLASDVKASFDRMAYPTNPDMAASLFAPIIQGMEVFNNEQRQLHIASQRSLSGIQGIVAIDEQTVRFYLTEPQPQFTYMLASPLAGIVPRELESTLAQHPVGSGPYRFQRRQSDTLYVLSYHESYWKDETETWPGRVEIRRYDSETAILNALRRHDADIAPNLSPLARMTALGPDGQLKSDILPEFKMIATQGRDYLSIYANPANRLGLNADQTGAVLNMLPADTLADRFSHLGLREVSRSLPAPSADFSRLRLEYAGQTLPVPTITFFLNNYESFLARNIHQLAQDQLPVAMVRSGVISPEITWSTQYTSNYENLPVESALLPDEILRIAPTRIAVVHNKIQDLHFNTSPWWLHLEGVTLNTTTPVP